MSIFYMNGKTFIKQFMKENPDQVLDSQYILVSNHIRKTGEHEDQVISNMGLFPSSRLIMDFDDYDDEEYQLEYMKQLESYKPFLATIIKYAIDDNMTIIMLCSKTEWKYKFFPVLKLFVQYEFAGYPIYDYKLVKKGKEAPINYDTREVRSICKKILKSTSKRERERTIRNRNTRLKWLQSLKKKDLIKELKKIGFYDEGMDKDDMIETLDLMLD